jgi:hypothetical protein
MTSRTSATHLADLRQFDEGDVLPQLGIVDLLHA